jgi:gamma-resorcylate decarboxylase
MDENGLGMTIPSLKGPAVQAIGDTKRAIAIAKEANNTVAEHVYRRSSRIQPRLVIG